MPKLHVISMPVDTGGCGWYRTRQPFEMMKRYTDADTYIVDIQKDDMNQITMAMANVCDVVVVRQGGEEGMRQIRKMPEMAHLKWVLDIDDNIEEISPYSEHFSEYGTYECQHEGKWLWKDGENGFDLKRNINKVNSLLKGMGEVDMVTVTTEKLAEYARKYSNNVKVLPNCINHDVWWKLKLEKDGLMRVGWSGGVSHYEDWYTIKEPLNRVMREHPFKLVMVGASFSGILDDDNKHLLEVHDWVPFKGHSYRMMCLGLDIALIPLKDMEFNKYKSAIKWYEMSAMGVPSIVSGITPYVPEANKTNSWVYNTQQEFETCLREALVNTPKLNTLAENAKQWVLDNRDAKTCANQWVNAYLSLL